MKIGASHGGISVGEDGATHQCLEDFTLMRSIPGMVVMALLMIRADSPRSASSFPASTASATSRPLAMMAISVPSRMTSPLPGLRLLLRHVRRRTGL